MAGKAVQHSLAMKKAQRRAESMRQQGVCMSPASSLAALLIDSVCSGHTGAGGAPGEVKRKKQAAAGAEEEARPAKKNRRLAQSGGDEDGDAPRGVPPRRSGREQEDEDGADDDKDLGGGEEDGEGAADGGLVHERFGDGQKVTVQTDGILSSADFNSLSLSEPTQAVRLAAGRLLELWV